MIGEVLEKYEVLEKVGEGGMATVYRGRHTTLDRTVAVKVLHPHLSSSEKNRKRFAREARAIESLRHPNILRIFDYSGATSDRCFIVTEFIRGPTLSSLLDDVGAMMPEPAALVGRELCKALQTAHAHGIVHRDLKPENVMLQDDASVKLMDFGIARLRDDVQVTMTGALVGSPAYMSPEQALSQEVDQRSDLFSLGTVLYRMVTGTLPFRGGNPSIVLKNIIDCTYEDAEERVPSLGAEMAGLIRRLLSREADARFANAGEVLEALDAFLRSVGIDPEAPGDWALSRYVLDSDEYEDRLRDWLVERLTARGQEEVEAGDTSAALRTFNRVMALDDDNEEVIAIISGMRPPLADEGRRGGPLLWVAPFVILGAAVVALIAGNRPNAVDAAPALDRIAPVPMLAVPVAEIRDVREEVEPEPVAEPTPRPPKLTIRPVTIGPGAAAGRNPDSLRPPGPGEAAPAPLDDPTPEPVAAVEPVYKGTGRLQFMALGAKPTVYVDGEKWGSLPMRWRELPAGKHTVRAVSPYTIEHTQTVTVLPYEEAKGPTQLDLELQYKPSNVVFEGFPPQTRVVVNGSDRGLAAEGLSLDETGRNYAVKLVADGQTLKQEFVRCGINAGQLLPGATKTVVFTAPN